MPDRKRATVSLYLRTGSRFETPDENGLSHFLEHMLFRGTSEHPSAHLLSTAFEDLGGTLDASTAADHGTLGIDVPHENLGRAISLMGEVIVAPSLHDLELERGIIREEILGDLGDDGEMIDPASLLRQLAFADNGLGQPIVGSLGNIESFTQEQLQKHHDKTYVGGRLAVSVAGPISTSEVTENLRSAFHRLQRGYPLKAKSPDPQQAPRFLFAKHPGSSQSSLSIGFRCPGHTSPAEPAVEMLLRVIDDGMATRLYHRLCDSRGLCYSVSGGFEAYEDTGLVEFEADTAHERASEVLKEILSLTSELAETRIENAEFNRTQKRARWQHEAYLDEAASSADFFAIAALSGTAPTPAARLEELLGVSREDIRDAALSIFSPELRNVVCVGSLNKSQEHQLRDMALSPS